MLWREWDPDRSSCWRWAEIAFPWCQTAPPGLSNHGEVFSTLSWTTHPLTSSLLEPLEFSLCLQLSTFSHPAPSAYQTHPLAHPCILVSDALSSRKPSLILRLGQAPTLGSPTPAPLTLGHHWLGKGLSALLDLELVKVDLEISAVLLYTIRSRNQPRGRVWGTAVIMKEWMNWSKRYRLKVVLWPGRLHSVLVFEAPNSMSCPKGIFLKRRINTQIQGFFFFFFLIFQVSAQMSPPPTSLPCLIPEGWVRYPLGLSPPNSRHPALRTPACLWPGLHITCPNR